MGIRGRSVLARFLTSAAAALAVSALAGPLPALAANSWSAPFSIGVGDSSDEDGPFVSCATASFCMAVNSSDGTAVVLKNGAWVRAPRPPFAPTGLSCPSVGFCAAIHDTDGRVAFYRRGRWSRSRGIDPTGAKVLSISCGSASFCVAGDDNGNLFRYNGRAWTPPTNQFDSSYVFGAVSCPTKSFCAAADQNGRVVVYRHRSWHRPARLLRRGHGFLSAISCASPTFCVVGDSNAHLAKFNGRRWGRLFDSGMRDQGPEPIDAISCLTTSFCAAVGASGDAVTYDGHAWSHPTLIDPVRINSAIENALYLSCARPLFCVAVDGYGDALTYPAHPS